MRTVKTTVVLATALVLAAPAALAAPGQPSGPSFGIGGGGAMNCAQVKRLITRNWFDLKQLMAGDDAGVKRPKTRDLSCIHPEYTRSMMPRTVPGVRGRLNCYAHGRRGVCCDTQMSACAML